MSTGETPRIGFYGKLPSHGDFVRWGLSRPFVSAWDSWLQAVSATDAEREPRPRPGDRCCRFALAPGLCGPSAVSGLLLNSADKVDRCFPLLLAVEGAFADDALLGELERLGRDAVVTANGRDELAARLRRIVPPEPPGIGERRPPSRWWGAGGTGPVECRGDSMPEASILGAFGVL